MRRKNRTPNREQARAMLDDLYAQLPGIECKGLCHDSCTAIDASELERERIAERGVTLPDAIPHAQVVQLIRRGEPPRCPALGPLNNCTVYDVRPFICRAYGTIHDPVSNTLTVCEHGCVPDGVISVADMGRALREIEELSFAVTGVSRVPEPYRKLMEALRDER